MFSKIRIFVSIFVSHLVHPLSYLIPRNEDIWAFVGLHKNKGRQLFTDNNKYMFLFAHSLPDIRTIWITDDRRLMKLLRDKGYESYHRSSPRGIYFALRAGLTFVDASFHRVNWRYCGGSKIIQLWHGKGFKKTGFESHKKSWKHNRLIRPQLFVRYHRAYATSPYTASMMSRTIRIPKEKVFATGLPRNDVFFRSIEGADIDSHPQLQNFAERKNARPGRYILYAPTWRRRKYDPVTQLELEQMDDNLKKQNSFLFISFHRLRFPYNSESLDTKNFSRITLIEPGYDLYPDLAHFDALITDYSSIFADFVLLDKPIYFFVPDLEDYKKTGLLYEDFEKYAPGPLAKTTRELLDALEKEDVWREKRRRARNLFFTHTDGHASERIVNNLKHL